MPLVVAAPMLGCEDAPTQKSGPAAPSARPQSKPRFVPGPSAGAAVAPFVRDQVAAATKRRERVIVYVGAPWCEPCGHFHRAVEAGELDDALPGLVFVEFNLDTDADALRAAGYASRMIPLFAVPDQEGRGTEHRIFGSIKGPGAVANITPRLTAMLAKAPAPMSTKGGSR